MAKTIFNMADGNLTPRNAACGSWIMTVNSPSGSRPTLQRDTWLWFDMSLSSPGGSTLQCGMWLWNHDSEFARWQHPAMTRSCGIMTLNSPGGSTLQSDKWLWDDMPLNSPKGPPY